MNSQPTSFTRNHSTFSGYVVGSVIDNGLIHSLVTWCLLN